MTDDEILHALPYSTIPDAEDVTYWRSLLAKAWDDGFEMAAELAGECCGCNVYNRVLDGSNPHGCRS